MPDVVVTNIFSGQRMKTFYTISYFGRLLSFSHNPSLFLTLRHLSYNFIIDIHTQLTFITAHSILTYSQKWISRGHLQNFFTKEVKKKVSIHIQYTIHTICPFILIHIHNLYMSIVDMIYTKKNSLLIVSGNINMNMNMNYSHIYIISLPVIW